MKFQKDLIFWVNRKQLYLMQFSLIFFSSTNKLMNELRQLFKLYIRWSMEIRSRNERNISFWLSNKTIILKYVPIKTLGIHIEMTKKICFSWWEIFSSPASAKTEVSFFHLGKMPKETTYKAFVKFCFLNFHTQGSVICPIL